MWPLLYAALGMLKGNKETAAAERDRKLQATTAMYSPWTGLKPTAVKEGDVFGSTMQGLTGGLGMQQGMQNQEQSGALNKAMLDYYKSKTPVAPEEAPESTAQQQKVPTNTKYGPQEESLTASNMPFQQNTFSPSNPNSYDYYNPKKSRWAMTINT